MLNVPNTKHIFNNENIVTNDTNLSLVNDILLLGNNIKSYYI